MNIEWRAVSRVISSVVISGLLSGGLSGCNDDSGSSTPSTPATPPTAVGDSYSTDQNAVLSVDAASGVLANDTDPNGLSLSAKVATQPAHGSLTLNADGSFTYTPATDFSGSDSFTYTAGDGQATSAAATVAITVNALAAVSPAGQSLVGVDPVNNQIWTPAATPDANGDLQFEIVNSSDVSPSTTDQLTAKALTPGGTLLALPGARTPIAITYNTISKSFWIEAADDMGKILVYVAKTADLGVTKIEAPDGVAYGGYFGGIIFNPSTNTAVVAGTCSLAVLDGSSATPTFIDNSVLGDGSVVGQSVLGTCTDSLSLNFETQQLFIADDGTNTLVDLSALPDGNPVISPFMSLNFETTDGNAFDSSTNLLVVTPEFTNEAFVLNMAETDLTASPVTAPMVVVDGLGTTGPVGEGPGGQATLNTVTHQAIIADEGGQNFWLLQLPSTAITGAPNNNGQPGSGTTADASSAYAVAAATIPQVDGQSLLILGDPAALGVDQIHNIAYMLASPSGVRATPLYLVSVDLSNPTQGGCAADGCTLPWTPKITTLQLD